jgi:hypothetical protein
MPGEAVEEWTFQRTCPFGLTITTGRSSLLFNASLDTISSWNRGDTHFPTSPMTAAGSQPLHSGVWEGSVRFQRQSCAVSVELDASPDADALTPHIHLHALSCAAPAPAPASRRLLLQAGTSDSPANESEWAPPTVVVADLGVQAAAATFVLDGATVATRMAVALPPADGPRLLYAPPWPCAAMGEARPGGRE